MSKAHETTMKIGIARCRDRTDDIRLVRAADYNNINDLGPDSRTETAYFGVLRSTSVGTRREYHAAYYQRTKARRQKLASYRHQRTHWTRWLLANLEWPAELAVTVPVPHPIRRPTLKLPRSPVTTRIT